MEGELDQTEEKIITAAFKILQTEGFSKATTKKIASEAGVNEVTIFRRFESKKNLIEITQEYYFKALLNKLENIFDFNEDDEIEKYLENNFVRMLSLSDSDFSIIKLAIDEGSDISERKLLIARITETIIGKSEEYFNLQIEKGNIRDVDARTLSIMCFSITFQSLVLWKINNKSADDETQEYAKSLLDIMYNGIKPYVSN